MTFSLVGRDARTNALGITVTSSSPCVGARCMHLRSGVGVVASQNVTDPRLGSQLLNELETGASADESLIKVLDGYQSASFRQLTVLSASGDVAHHSGKGTLGTNRVVVGTNCIAAGNLLSSEVVPQKMVDAFEASEGEDLETRLLKALTAGEKAGGEMGNIRSCGLAVVHDVGWRVTDLRVDDADEPIAELKRLLDVWAPQRDDYITRGIDPAASPSYGVPGDE